jgi:hypothetical protein
MTQDAGPGEVAHMQFELTWPYGPSADCGEDIRVMPGRAEELTSLLGHAHVEYKERAQPQPAARPTNCRSASTTGPSVDGCRASASAASYAR